jgi:cell division protein FtsB
MGDLEKQIMEKKVFSFSIKDLKWVITSAIMGIGLIITIILWIGDRGKAEKLSQEVKKLREENTELKTEVSKVQGQVEGVSEAAEIFMKNSPSENRFRIELLEGRVLQLEKPGSNPPIPVPELDTSNVISRDIR